MGIYLEAKYDRSLSFTIKEWASCSFNGSKLPVAFNSYLSQLRFSTTAPTLHNFITLYTANKTFILAFLTDFHNNNKKTITTTKLQFLSMTFVVIFCFAQTHYTPLSALYINKYLHLQCLCELCLVAAYCKAMLQTNLTAQWNQYNRLVVYLFLFALI